MKAFGEPSGLGCGSALDTCTLQWTLEEPSDATDCSAESPVENGRVIAIPVSVQTATGQDLSTVGQVFNPNNFSALEADGVTLPSLATASAYGCAESARTIPGELAPGSRYEGFIVLDVPTDAQSIIYRTSVAEGGWEWPLS